MIIIVLQNYARYSVTFFNEIIRKCVEYCKIFSQKKLKIFNKTLTYL